MSSKKSVIKKIVLFVILGTGAFFGYQKVRYNMTHETTDNAQIETQIVPVLPRVAGYIKMLAVTDFDSVHTGQLLAELDDADIQVQMAQALADSVTAVADLQNAKVSLQSAEKSLSVNKGMLQLNEVKYTQAKTDFERNEKLYRDQAITEKQFTESKFQIETAKQNLEDSKNDMSAAESKLPILQAAINKCEASLQMKHTKIEEIKLKLQYTHIYAPANGKIGRKNITNGQYVQAGMPLFSIVNDSIYWVTANFKENQIRNLFAGKQVDLRVDAFPDESLTGTIESISDATGAKFALLPPDNSSGNFVKVTQRVPVKIKINDPEKHRNIMHAGLSVFVTATIQ